MDLPTPEELRNRRGANAVKIRRLKQDIVQRLKTEADKETETTMVVLDIEDRLVASIQSWLEDKEYVVAILPTHPNMQVTWSA
jgi:hypothetical protein